MKSKVTAYTIVQAATKDGLLNAVNAAISAGLGYEPIGGIETDRAGYTVTFYQAMVRRQE